MRTVNTPSPVAIAILGVLATGSGLAAWSQSAPRSVPLPTTIDDFFLPGTQPDPTGNVIEPIVGAIEGSCTNCHSNFDAQYVAAEPYRHWNGSMMAQAARDPLFFATLTVAEQDAPFSGDFCLRCHSPAAWLNGRSTPTDGSALAMPADFDGVTCHFCHRAVDPVYEAGVSPASDAGILAALAHLPADFGSGKYVVDPDAKVRRGPLSGSNHPQGATAIYSPFHSESTMCATCHDVSNPAFTRQPDGTYAPNAFGQPHPTLLDVDMFPVERTYSEWKHSAFAAGGVQMNGRFGGNHPTGVLVSCQDCHMPDQVGPGARNGTVRQHAPQHALNGGNTWMLRSVRSLYPDSETGLTAAMVADAEARVVGLLQAASDMALSQDGDDLEVRITNYGGHKLPTGYPEGRRMWLNVKFFDGEGALIAERGHYDNATAVLTTGDTKVYETKLGVDATVAGATGVPEGESFHFVLNNVRLKDNRIPPMGFTNAAFDAVGAAPVGATYADGQHWDDTEYDIPFGAASAEVRLYYQTSSKEYIDFLLAENTTDSRGQTLYNQWVLHGKSAPVEMDFQTIALTPVGATPDLNGDGEVDGADLGLLLGAWGTPDADLNGDGNTDGADLGLLLGAWGPVS
ncbi:MAG: hypothetical protein ACF8QF_03450 [Phycisphaerales bacterium]